jgi:isoleucyl-tRNA synthetase
VREAVLKKLEEARQAKLIGTALEARVRLRPPLKSMALLEEYGAMLPSLFIVSQVVLDEPSDDKDAVLEVSVERADGAKCERCWKYSTKVGEDVKYPTVCDACSAALKEMLG